MVELICCFNSCIKRLEVDHFLINFSWTKNKETIVKAEDEYTIYFSTGKYF